MGIVDWYNDVMVKSIDPRTKDWFLVTGPGPLLMIVISYAYFSIVAGPKYMRDKKPYTLRKTLIVYNFIQVLLSVALFWEGGMGGWFGSYNFACEKVDRSMSPKALRMARAVWLYYVCKLSELLDTVFFVLRKKQRQISFLHVFHHSIMPATAWIAVRYFPGGQATLCGFVNAFIHIIMYAYYMLSAMGPSMQKYLWWKKYLTVLQLVQFSIVVVQTIATLSTDCEFPRFLTFLLLLNSLLFMYMFGSFYVHNYTKVNNNDKMANIHNGAVGNQTRANGVKAD